MQLCLEHLDQLLGSSLNRTKTSLTLVGLSGRMGETWYYSKSIGNYSECIGLTPPETKQQDTLELVRELVDANVDAILYAGGDGTTRDIVTALEQKGEAAQKIPLIGVPGGVKMHSGCFATTPKAAAEVTLAFAMGDLRTAITEVMDLDEVVYQEGVWKVRMYGEAWTPSSPRFMQGAKEQVERASEEETIEGLAHHVQVLLEDDPDLMVIWGSGGTLRRMGEHVGQNLTLLGIDIYHGETLHNDLNESQLLEIISAHKESNGDARALLLLLSPMGGQGFLIGRGNLQLSPDVLRMVGHDNILGVATPSKLIGLDAVRIDTGDSNLDDAFQDKRFIKILQGFRTTRLIRVAEM